MLKKLKTWKTHRYQFDLAAAAELAVEVDHKPWIVPGIWRDLSIPGYSTDRSELDASPAYSDHASPTQGYHCVSPAELDSGRDFLYYPSTPCTRSAASPGVSRFSSALTAVPSEIIQYPYSAKKETITSVAGVFHELNEAPHPSANNFLVADALRRWNLKHASPRPSLRITTQTEKAPLSKVYTGDAFPELSADLNGLVKYNAKRINAAANVSDWLFTLQIDDETTPPSIQVDCGSDPTQASPSERDRPEQWPVSHSPSGLSQTSVFTSEGEASFVLGGSLTVCTTLRDSEEFTTLVSTFAKAFVSSYLDRTNPTTASPDSPSQKSSASNSSGVGNAGQSSSLATTPTSLNAQLGIEATSPKGRQR